MNQLEKREQLRDLFFKEIDKTNPSIFDSIDKQIIKEKFINSELRQAITEANTKLIKRKNL